MSSIPLSRKYLCTLLALALATFVPTSTAWSDTQHTAEEVAAASDTPTLAEGDETPDASTPIADAETAPDAEKDPAQAVADATDSPTSAEPSADAAEPRDADNNPEAQSDDQEAIATLADAEEALPAGTTFLLRSSASQTAVVDIYGGSRSEGANVQVWESNMTQAQRFTVSYDNEGYATLTNPASGLVLDVQGAMTANCTNVHLWSPNGTNAQKWIIKKSAEGALVIASALKSDLVLDVANGSTNSGTNVQVFQSNGTAAQKFFAVDTAPQVKAGNASLPEGYYTIATCADTQYVLDMPNASQQEFTRAGLFQANGTLAQRYYLKPERDGFYSVRCAVSNLALGVVGGNMVSTTAIEQKSYRTDDSSLLWALDENADGSITFRSAVSGLTLDVPYGVPMNGRLVQTYTPNGTAAQRWMVNAVAQTPASLGLTKVSLKSGVYHIMFPTKTDQIIDISCGSTDNGANCQLFTNNSTSAQRFRIESDGTTCTIINNKSEKALDVAGASFEIGANVQQFDRNSTDAQKWDTYQTADGRYVFIARCNGLALDVSGGSTSNGANVQVYTPNGSDAQCFKLKEVADNRELINRLNSGQVTKIKTVGDSITAGYRTDGWIDPTGDLGKEVFHTDTETWYEEPSLARCYANEIRRYAQDREIAFTNAGACGAKMLDLANFSQNWLEADDDVVFVMLGTNDFQMSPLFFEQYAPVALSAAAAQSNTLIVMTAPGLAEGYENTAFPMSRQDEILRKICEDNGYLHLSGLGALPYSPNNFVDVLHPNSQGNMILWSAIKDNLCL